MRQDLVPLIVKQIHELNGQHGVKVPADLSSDTPLFGREGILESLGLVSLVVSVEQAIEDEFGVSISLADDRALAQTKSPYRTVASLAEYAGHLIQQVEGQHG
ncbi:MAG: acyl carrier protein [Gammaproteobacteria bacterium]|nr:acyl carrier protein [Gammaproteobacteria bacterium]